MLTFMQRKHPAQAQNSHTLNSHCKGEKKDSKAFYNLDATNETDFLADMNSYMHTCMHLELLHVQFLNILNISNFYYMYFLNFS